MGHGGYCEGKIVARFSTKVEETEKRSEGGDQRLRRWRPALAGAFQKKISNSLCIPLADIFAERTE
jgi:hypothetical protein